MPVASALMYFVIYSMILHISLQLQRYYIYQCEPINGAHNFCAKFLQEKWTFYNGTALQLVTGQSCDQRGNADKYGYFHHNKRITANPYVHFMKNTIYLCLIFSTGSVIRIQSLCNQQATIWLKVCVNSMEYAQYHNWLCYRIEV